MVVKMDVDTAEEVQKERREYVKNLGIEYRFLNDLGSVLQEKRSDSCHLLGEYMEAIEQNLKVAYMLFRQNCEKHRYPRSCYKYGMYTLAGKECKTDVTKMIEPMKIACDGELKEGCRYLALAYWNGEKHRAPDPQRAEMYMRRACEMEDGEACWLLSTWYMGNKERFVAEGKHKVKKLNKEYLGSLDRNMCKSLEYGIKACDLGVPQSCANVARMYKLGDDIEKNLDESKKYVDKARELIEMMKSFGSTPGFTG